MGDNYLLLTNSKQARYGNCKSLDSWRLQYHQSQPIKSFVGGREFGVSVIDKDNQLKYWMQQMLP